MSDRILSIWAVVLKKLNYSAYVRNQVLRQADEMRECGWRE